MSKIENYEKNQNFFNDLGSSLKVNFKSTEKFFI